MGLVFSAIMLSAALGSGGIEAARKDVSWLTTPVLMPVAEGFASEYTKISGRDGPSIEAMNADAAFGRFCQGIGLRYPDFVLAARSISSDEKKTCLSRGVTVIELPLAVDAVVLVQGPGSRVTGAKRRDLFLAIAKDVPAGSNEQIVPNPYFLWSDVNPALPDQKIEILMTSDPIAQAAFNDLALSAAARGYKSLAALEAKDVTAFRQFAHGWRRDLALRVVEEVSAELAAASDNGRPAVGIMPFAGAAATGLPLVNIEGVKPNSSSIGSETYPLTRRLRLTVKREHGAIVSSMPDLLGFLVAEGTIGEEGVVTAIGLTPVPGAERAAAVRSIAGLTGDLR